VRDPKPALAQLALVGTAAWPVVKAYDLDAMQQVPVERTGDGRLLVVGHDSTHDYVLGLRRGS
jgi:hypothetical protein